MPSSRPRAVFAVLSLLFSGAGALTGAAQDPATAPKQGEAPPVSLDRIREGLERAPAMKIEVKLPVATFRTTTEARVLMLPFDEYLRKELELTPMQRQSADWASRCCGLDLGLLFDPIERALDRRKMRLMRERIARELEQLEEARKARDRAAK